MGSKYFHSQNIGKDFTRFSEVHAESPGHQSHRCSIVLRHFESGSHVDYGRHGFSSGYRTEEGKWQASLHWYRARFNRRWERQSHNHIYDNELVVVRLISKYRCSSTSIETSILLIVSFFLISLASHRSEAQTLRGTPPTINVTTAIVGSEPTPVVNTGSQIRYDGPNYISKITVGTVCANQKFELSVVAGSIPNGRGTAAPEVSLLNGMLDADFITDIPKKANRTTVTLQYTASPKFSDGTGTDAHTVTYTQVAQ